MVEHIIKIKHNCFFKYGVIEGDIVEGINQVHCCRGITEIAREDFDVIDDESITPQEVYQANSYKEFKNDRSVYLDITEQYRCENSYNRLYKEEIEQNVKAWVRMIDLIDKGRKYERLAEL